ncbi:glycosyltransferase family 9 protein [Agarivorans sp. QJM3NY_33]|uniref:glycosyltransferase family 9 protein n=1 Tax=Agarivorans sp. QJM3NY_33 TaxID=3421432 RepID=UPI003D7E1E26
MSLIKRIRTALRQFDSKRRERSIGLEVAFLKLLGGRKGRLTERLQKSQIKRVLIIRNNKRIGNMFFLLPFVNYVQALYPDAEVELLLSDPWQGKVFENLGLKNIHFSQFGLKTIPAFIRSIHQLRKHSYDLILLPYGGSSDRIVAALTEGKNVHAFDGPADAAVCSHTVKYQHKYSHYALGCLELLEYLGLPPVAHASACLKLSHREQQYAAEQLKQMLGEHHHKPCLAYFRGARGSKIVDDEKWQVLLAKFKQYYAGELNVIEILSPDIAEPLSHTHFTYLNRDLRQLAAFLQQVSLFICGDTGPLHLASAAGARCVGLFTMTNVMQYGCLGEHVVNICDLDALQPQPVLRQLGLS